jgi:hypothetical protein
MLEKKLASEKSYQLARDEEMIPAVLHDIFEGDTLPITFDSWINATKSPRSERFKGSELSMERVAIGKNVKGRNVIFT